MKEEMIYMDDLYDSKCDTKEWQEKAVRLFERLMEHSTPGRTISDEMYFIHCFDACWRD